MLVSVIIPCYNVEKFIAECLDSVLKQTYSNLEIICIDNNSTDKTYSILEEYQKRFPFKIKLKKELQKGAPYARNNGLNIAQGKWIQFLDADDLLIDSKLEHQINLLHNKTNIAFVCGACKRQNSKNEIYTTVYPSNSNGIVNVFTNNAGITSANLWSKESVIKVGGWNVDLKSSQETDLMLRILLAGGNCINDNEPLTTIRERESGQISQSDPKGRWARFIAMRLKHLSSIKVTMPLVYEQYRSEFVTYILSSIFILAPYDLKLAKTFIKEIGGDINSVKCGYGVTNNIIKVIEILGIMNTLTLISLKNRIFRR